MPRYKNVTYQQTIYVSIHLDKQILPGTLEFAIHHLVEYLDLSCFDEHYKNDEMGAPATPPKVLLKVVLLGYSRGFLSSRKMERACKENMVFIAISGNLQPDHSTIATFVSSMDQEVLDIFCQILAICHSENLMGKEMLALDGLKLPSNASKEWSGTFDQLKKKMAKIQKKIEKLKELHDPSAEEDSLFDKSKAIENLQKKADKINRFLKENQSKKGSRRNEIQSNITDNDSAKMATSHGYIQGYNVQALVDDKHQVILSAVASGQGQDYQHLEPVMERAVENMKTPGESDDYFDGVKLAMDANYFSETNLQTAELYELNAYVPDNNFRKRDERFENAHHHKPKKSKFSKNDFRYHSDNDTFTCPGGTILVRYCSNAMRKGRKMRIYRNKKNSCIKCDFRERCIKNQKAKRKNLCIRADEFENPDKNLSLKMREKIDSTEGKQIYALRMKIIEPVFGNTRYNKKMDRFTLRSEKKVDIQWNLYSVVHNIEKILHFGDVGKYVNEH